MVNRSEWVESMTIDFSKGVDVAKAACVCLCQRCWSMNLTEDIYEEIVTNVNVRSQ